MSTHDYWLLPEGIEEVLPEEARELERMRRGLLDLFDGWGYELVMPPMIEYLDSLLTGLGQDLDIQTFKITDQVTGRMMGVRADMTPQVARIEAHYLKRKGPVRLCYIGPVLHTRPGAFGGSREPLQMGAELFGHPGPQSDVEILSLMVSALAVIGVDTPHLDLGHVGVFRELLRRYEVSGSAAGELFETLARRSQPDLEALLADNGLSSEACDAFVALAELNGGSEVLSRARAVLGKAGKGVAGALDNLEQVAAQAAARMPTVPLYFDLAELRGYHYHTGTVFSAFMPGQGQAIAQGGRYDDIGKLFGYARPATGFSTDLRTLLRLVGAPAESARGIRAPSDDDAELEAEIARLRGAGERVVRDLPGADVTPSCPRRLVRRDGRWIVE